MENVKMELTSHQNKNNWYNDDEDMLLTSLQVYDDDVHHFVAP